MLKADPWLCTPDGGTWGWGGEPYEMPGIEAKLPKYKASVLPAVLSLQLWAEFGLNLKRTTHP